MTTFLDSGRLFIFYKKQNLTHHVGSDRFVGTRTPRRPAFNFGVKS